MQKKPQLLFSIFLSLISLLIGLALCEVICRFYKISRLPPALSEKTPAYYMRYDELVGWRPIPGVRVGGVSIDNWGGRVGADSPIDLPLREKRILAFGDSFTFGDTVQGEEAWPALLEERLAEWGYSVVNLGVCAYGVDQMYLLYQELEEELQPDIVLAGIISWDVQRVPKTRRKAEAREKPMFVYEGGELRLTNVPVPMVEKEGLARISWKDILFDTSRSYLLDRIRTSANPPRWTGIPETVYTDSNVDINKYARGLLISQKILEQWRKETMKRGQRLILVLIPTVNEVDYYHSYLIRLKKNLADQGLEIVDCQKAFQSGRGKGWNLFRGNHPSPRGQAVIAEEVFSHLEDSATFSHLGTR
ncbi:MAG: GDSL-type esterase/lipase family protein [Candidatus Erginobacter occultus]|nr:GDSL-type esterase/lipase family protein [Candidatus Erginobacter occultus]